MSNNNKNPIKHNTQSKKQTSVQHKKNESSKSKRNKMVLEENTPNYYLIPIFFVLCIIPLIVRMKSYDPNMSQFHWYANIDSFTDFFLYYKQWTLIFVAGVMAIIIALKTYYDHKSIRFSPILIPLAIYGLLSFLSAIFSKYASFSFNGSFEQFESVFALLGYCIIVYYGFLFINSEHDLKAIFKFLIGVALIMSILGVFQFLGHDFFNTSMGYKLIMPLKYQSSTGLNRVFENNRVYLTLYNPNYVGVYVALVTPIIMIMLFFQRNIKNIILSVVIIVGLVICAVGAQSLAGAIGLGVAFISILVLMWRNIVKRYYITIPVILLLVIGLVVLNNQTDQLLINKLVNTAKNSKSDFALTQMDTNRDNVSVTYNGNKMYFKYKENDETVTVEAMDENNQNIAGTFDAVTYSFQITDERFSGITYGIKTDDTAIFYIQESGFQWLFTNQTEDGTYYHINRMGKLDKMITAPSAVFTGYEWFASGRGYIWSRTIPLLKDYVFLGSGPDTFAMVFPQQDYINFNHYQFTNGIITKPHNLYFQIATQTGILSLIAFLTFYMMYFVSSVRLYSKGHFNSKYAQFGVAIFAGTIAYMVTGLANDSSTTTAPIFWMLMGIGLAVNYKVRPLILKETAELKAKNSSVKAAK